jgi:uncharacterized cupredoxin-like copper-binding protein
LLGAAKNRLKDIGILESEERLAMGMYQRKDMIGEKLKRAALMCVLGSFAVVGLAACGGAVATTAPATATVAPPTATLAAIATTTSMPTALPTRTATAKVATPTIEAVATDTPTEEPMAMETPTIEAMIMEANTPTTKPAATATQVAVAPEATATTASSQSAGDSAVSAVLKEWALDLSVSEVAAGKVTFTVTNQGSMGHNLTVVDSSGSVIGATATFRPSEGAQTLEVTLTPGTYTVLCSLPGHAARGQQAQLVVK